MTQDANDILMGSGSPALKFPTVGTVHTGTVASEPIASQQTNFRTKAPETWSDGSPKMQIIVQLSTALRDPQKPEDDGTRSLYIKGKELTNAIRTAVKASGANGIHIGGVLTIQYVGNGTSTDPNIDPPKLYAASYQPPAVSFNGVTTPPVQQAAPPAAVHQPVYPHHPVQQPMVQVPVAATNAPPGVDPAMWVRLTPAQQQAVLNAQPQPAGQPGY